MKRKIVVVNFVMSLAVLFAMLFQTVHSYEHVFKQLFEKHCEHKNLSGHTQITHSHTTENNCPICHFAFSTFIPHSFQTFSFHKITAETTGKFFYASFSAAYFKGSLFALRAPPAI
ncbi:hypothetical protein J0383_00890 [Flavobacterium endoglycinae]|uniref:DUF2946 domain-containing protein n=1 Tax=Flavobacterium endoglycinae TaxID=2816357 RepID=A0ABX7QFI3_9FLAO|nr:hypothetical protein [Flavobacterium endoglycinae]QSW89383.1 hypothetical protein J0383_00890 [Flavobacterium endoglycinae]